MHANTEEDNQVEGEGTERYSTARRRVVSLLVVFGSFFLFLGIFTESINRQVLDSNEWAKTSTELLEREEIKEALSIYLVAQLYEVVDVEKELKKALPKDLKGLSGPAAGGLREGAQRLSKQALGTSTVQSSWREANLQAHKTLMNILEGNGDVVSTDEGTVTLNLRPLIEEVGERVGVLGSLKGGLPKDVGQLEVLQSDELSEAQDAVTVLRGLAIVFALLALAFYVTAIWLARGRRRKTLIVVGVGFLVAGVMVLVARHFAGQAIVNALASTASVKPAAGAAWSVGTRLLREVAVAVAIYGILLIAAGWIAGPSRSAIAIRRSLAPYLREYPGYVYGGLAILLLIVIAWGPTAATRAWLGLLIIIVLLVLGTEVLRRQTAREFADAGVGDTVKGVRQAITRGWTSATTSVAAARKQPGDKDAPVDDREKRLGQLERLGSLKDKGVLTEEEFEAEKREILDDKPADTL